MNKYHCEHEFQPMTVPDRYGLPHTIWRCGKCGIKKSIGVNTPLDVQNKLK